MPLFEFPALLVLVASLPSFGVKPLVLKIGAAGVRPCLEPRLLPVDDGGRQGRLWRLPVLLLLPLFPFDPGNLKVDDLGFGFQFLALPVTVLHGAAVVTRFRRP